MGLPMGKKKKPASLDEGFQKSINTMKNNDYVVMVTLHSAYTPLPSAAVALMVQVPAAIPFTTPLLLTWATLPLLVLHITFLMVAAEGAM